MKKFNLLLVVMALIAACTPPATKTAMPLDTATPEEIIPTRPLETEDQRTPPAAKTAMPLDTATPGEIMPTKPLETEEPQLQSNYTITASSITEGGQISPSSLTVPHGESASFLVTASEGFFFSHLEGCPGVMVDDEIIIESVTSPCELKVSFNSAVLTYKTVLVEENIWEYSTSEIMPGFEYAGVQSEGGVVTFFPQAHIVADMWEDGFPDVLVPFNKGYGSSIDTRFPPVLFKNDGQGFFQEASDELIGGMPAIPGLRRTIAFSDPGSGYGGIFGVAHDTGDGKAADAILLVAGEIPENATDTLPRLPLADIFGRDNAVNAHSMTGGDLTGDGRTDFIVGDLSGPGPFKLMQYEPGKWQVVEDPFLVRLAYEQPMENPDAGEGFNLLLDLHLADMDGDSFDDLIVGWGHGSTKNYIYFNDGQGGFSDNNRKALPVSIYGVDNSLHLRTWSFDANGDDYLDLLILYSRYTPYYGGYTLQLLLNDGAGDFQDYTTVGMQNLENRDRSIGSRLQWSNNFYLIDVNRDGMVDIIGSDNNGVRIWINEPGAIFREIPVNTYEEHRGAPHIFVDMGNGQVSALVFRKRLNDERTETRIWFDQVNLVFGTVPVTLPVTMEELEPQFVDEFDEALLSGWEWVAGSGDQSNLNDLPGFLRVSLTQENRFLLRLAPEDDFIIKTRLLFKPISNFQRAGLVIFQDDQNFMYLVRAYCGFEPACVMNGIYFDNIVANQAVGSNYGTVPSIDSEIYLSIRKSGNTFTAYYSEDGVHWYFVGEHISDISESKIGLLAGNSSEQILADFDYFSISELP